MAVGLDTMSAGVDLRPLTLEELPRCVPYATAFHEELRLPGQLIPEVFLKNWTTFLTQYPATILSLWKEETLIGGLGAMIVPDLSDGRLCATEMFIFIDKSHRGGSAFFRLLRAYKEWAIAHHAVEVRLSHMEHGEDHAEIDAQFDRLYRKLGYRPLERSYVLPLEGEELCR